MEMNSSMNWYMPTRLVTGTGCVRKAAADLKKLGSRCLIVTGRHSAKASGALDDVTAALAEADVAWTLFDGIGQNPKVADCMTAALQGQDFGAEFVIGIGGGSPLDAAKCTAVFLANPGMTEAELYTQKWPVRPGKIVAVGTTAGTGSEVTKVAVMTNSAGHKKSLHHEDLYPCLSLGDPAYTASLSDEFTRNTAIDAFAHCVESYFNRNANELTRSFSVRGIQILLEQFRQMLSGDGSLRDPLALTADNREALYDASIYGGLAINMPGTAMPHAMGYLLTEEHKVPHGPACAAFLPAFHAHNKAVAPELTARFLRDCGTTEEEFLHFVKVIPSHYDITITEEEIAAEHSRWVNNGSIGKSLGTITPEEADQILRNL